MKIRLSSLLLIAAFAALAQRAAAERMSASYSIAAETADAGGQRAASANYTNDGSAARVAGVSTVAAPVEKTNHGYIGQLFDIADFLVNAAPPSVNETETLQLGAWHLLDDATFLRIPATAVAWSVVSGPITGISAEGVATAGIVHQDTAATVQGALAGDDDAIAITVLDSLPDNFGAYAGDGLADGWQVQYFGLENPLAAPALDPDGDGQSNAFEFVAGLIPTDDGSVFRLRIESVPGQPEHKAIVFSPRFPDRTYAVKSAPDLPAGDWLELPAATFSDSGDERTVTDLNATEARKFYHVEITRP